METRQQSEEPRIVPMRGREVQIMFGDNSVLELEKQLEDLDQEIKAVQEAYHQEDDLEEQEKMLARVQELLEIRKGKDREVRKQQREFGNKRGPITLH